MMAMLEGKLLPPFINICRRLILTGDKHKKTEGVLSDSSCDVYIILSVDHRRQTPTDLNYLQKEAQQQCGRLPFTRTTLFRLQLQVSSYSFPQCNCKIASVCLCLILCSISPFPYIPVRTCVYFTACILLSIS